MLVRSAESLCASARLALADAVFPHKPKAAAVKMDPWGSGVQLIRSLQRRERLSGRSRNISAIPIREYQIAIIGSRGLARIACSSNGIAAAGCNPGEAQVCNRRHEVAIG